MLLGRDVVVLGECGPRRDAFVDHLMQRQGLTRGRMAASTPDGWVVLQDHATLDKAGDMWDVDGVYFNDAHATGRDEALVIKSIGCIMAQVPRTARLVLGCDPHDPMGLVKRFARINAVVHWLDGGRMEPNEPPRCAVVDCGNQTDGVAGPCVALATQTDAEPKVTTDPAHFRALPVERHWSAIADRLDAAAALVRERAARRERAGFGMCTVCRREAAVCAMMRCGHLCWRF